MLGFFYQSFYCNPHASEMRQTQKKREPASRDAAPDFESRSCLRLSCFKYGAIGSSPQVLMVKDNSTAKLARYRTCD